MPQLKNLMEELVINSLEDVLKDINTCKCETCVTDITAIALNSLPPKYIVTQVGELYSKSDLLRQQFEVDIISAITKAAVIVKRNPRHS